MVLLDIRTLVMNNEELGAAPPKNAGRDAKRARYINTYMHVYTSTLYVHAMTTMSTFGRKLHNRAY